MTLIQTSDNYTQSSDEMYQMPKLTTRNKHIMFIFYMQEIDILNKNASLWESVQQSKGMLLSCVSILDFFSKVGSYSKSMSSWFGEFARTTWLAWEDVILGKIVWMLLHTFQYWGRINVMMN